MANHIATVTSKGQVTVPVAVRQHMGLQAGDRVLFVPEASRMYVLRLPGEVSSAELYGALRRSNTKRPDVEQARIEARAIRESRR